MYGVPPSRRFAARGKSAPPSTPRTPPRSALRADERGPDFRRGLLGAAVGLLLVGGVGLLPGCNTAATPSLPAADFRAEVGVRFPLRAGDLGLVIGATNYLYVSIGSVGLDGRCLAEPCEESGYLELALEVEDRERQGAVRLRLGGGGAVAGSFSNFEIRGHEVAPAPRAGRIPLTDYVVVLSVTEREPPAG